MHNLSNTYYQNEYESASQYENNYELAPEFESFNESEYELQPEYEYENNEMEYESLAQELQEISSEAEFESWFKKVLKKGAGLASKFISSPIGQQATAALGNIAQKTLPGFAAKAGGWLGGKIGGIVGQSDYGRQLGQQLGTRGAQAGLDRYPAFVKMASDALGSLSNEFEMGGAPAVKPAIIKAAAKHYPIILQVKGKVDGRPVQGNIRGGVNSEFEYEGEIFGESRDGEIMNNEGTFNEVTEMELASELLAVQSEAELDQFLGKLFKKAVGTVSKFARSGTGKMLGGVLKGIAKKALPVAGAALGSIVPGVGTAIGGALGSAASNLFELELEGMSAEDREFETARAYVRFAGNAARRASRIRNAPPSRAARSAVMTAAKRFAPGLLMRPNTTNNYITNNGDGNTSEEGTWYRDGGRIVLEGA